MTRGVLGLNTRTIGVSRDEVISAVREIDCAVSLVMDDPELVAELSTMGVQVVYRQHDDQRLDIDPAQFVAERAKNAPSAGYIALTNEVVSSPQLHAWTRKALEAATAQGVKAVAYSYGTNAPASHFQDAYDNLVYMRQHGHALGVHLYPDGKPDHEATLKEFLTLKHALGLTVICTEFGYLRDFGNGTEGWRGLWNADQRAAFLEAWMPFFDAEQIPVCQFCFDPWDQPTVEKAKSDGLGFWDYPDVLQTMAALNARYPFKGMPTMPVTVPINPGAPVQAAATTALKLRSNAGTRYPQVGSIAAHENVTCYPASEVVNVYPWVFVERADGQRGWAARADTDGTAWIVPVPPPDAPTFQLHPPFAQYVIVAHFNAPRPNYATQYPGKLALHEGCDFEPVPGSSCDPVVHVGAPGQVSKVAAQPTGYGNFVVIDHADGWQTVYAHFAEVYVKAGQALTDGQIIGLMGSTGSSSEPHVHITLSNPKVGLSGYVFPYVVNPEDFLVK